MIEVSHTLASIAALALFIAYGAIIFLVLQVRNLKRENSELESEIQRAAQDYALLRDMYPYPPTREEVNDGHS
jgi:hypothetical protein